EYALRLINDGADIIDVGGESTRPHARAVSVQEEIDRVIPTIGLLRKKSGVLISVDTSKMQVAREALDAGADIINNVNGTRMARSFLKMISNYEAAIVIMHSRGTPRTMRSLTHYKDLLGEIIEDLSISVEKCLDSGVNLDRIIIDPGFGFAKSAQQNFSILKQLAKFSKIKKPLLIGTSRKSFIGMATGQDVSDRIWGTAASVALSIAGGAHIIRVHDVKEMYQAAQVADAVLNPELVEIK
ncbi:MAG: dihydropteroate synthase, partial [Candidatus Omnitrophica bacterium]|nr:dihydropteroate synthase [Candidatus Omnitrophota bacterium]